MPSLRPHQRRVLIERDELAHKINKLHRFVVGETFKALPEDEQERLLRQLSFMGKYHEVLVERIAVFVWL